jgi:hypothetical protein
MSNMDVGFYYARGDVDRKKTLHCTYIYIYIYIYVWVRRLCNGVEFTKAKLDTKGTKCFILDYYKCHNFC